MQNKIDLTKEEIARFAVSVFFVIFVIFMLCK